MSIKIGIKKLIILTFLFTVMITPSIVKAETDTNENTHAISYITNTRVNLRAEANLNAQIYRTMPIGVEVNVVAYDRDGWSAVVADGIEGYVKTEYITKKEDYIQEEFEHFASGVELLNWSEASDVFTLYTPAKVYDVWTGLTYYIQSFSNGKHADVETLTQQDTNILLQTYGGIWQWDPRPVWVTINGRTLAASINGMPHGGGTISGNGMNGQVCLHFKGSTTHNGNQAFTRDHQNAIDIAWAAR